MPRYVGLFEGSARKAVRLAHEHPKVEVVAVDKKKIDPAPVLKRMGIGMPRNLTIKDETDAVRYVGSLGEGSVDHFWAHFPDPENVDAEKRLHEKIMRALKPGGRYMVVHSALNKTAMSASLKKAGFRVHTRPLTPKQASEMGTDTADRDVASIQRLRKKLASMPDREAKEHKDRSIHGMRSRVESSWKEAEGPGMSKAAKKQLKQMLNDVPLLYGDKPFVAIHARKPKARA